MHKPTRSSFSNGELRAAILALDYINRYGRQDDLDYSIRQAVRDAPADPWETPGQALDAGSLAHRLAGLLGVSAKRCEQAAIDALGQSPERRIYGAILDYAAELHGRQSAVKQEGPNLLELYDRHGLDAMIDCGPPCSALVGDAAEPVQHGRPGRTVEPIPAVLVDKRRPRP